MTETVYRVRNWDHFQHYKDRNPPWIKLHTELLDNYEFGRLDDASKLLAFACMLLAARTSNRIPADSDWVRAKSGIKGKVDFGPLIIYGFLEAIQPLPSAEQVASKPLADCKQSAISEERRDRGETEAASAALAPTKNRSARAPKGTRIPDEWEPLSNGMTLPADFDLRGEADKFRDYWRGRAGAGGVKADWPATWRNWVRRAVNDGTYQRNRRTGTWT